MLSYTRSGDDDFNILAKRGHENVFGSPWKGRIRELRVCSGREVRAPYIGPGKRL